MSKPYRHSRFKWLFGGDLNDVKKELEKDFDVETIIRPKSDTELDPWKMDRDEIKVKADTLTVSISRMKAVLFQKNAAPFTEKDVLLRKKIFEMYPRISPFPFQLYRREPKFETATQQRAF